VQVTYNQNSQTSALNVLLILANNDHSRGLGLHSSSSSILTRGVSIAAAVWPHLYLEAKNPG